MSQKVNVKKIISAKGQWVHYNDLKGTSDSFFHIKSRKAGANLHLILGAVSQVRKVPSSDQWRCRTTAKHNRVTLQLLLYPHFPSKWNKTSLKKSWSLSVRHDSCWNSILNTKQSPYLWGERSKQTEQEDFGSHRGYREKEITLLAVLLVVNQHFCLSQRFNLPFSGAEHSSQEEFHPGKALKGLVQLVTCAVSHSWTQSSFGCWHKHRKTLPQTVQNQTEEEQPPVSDLQKAVDKINKREGIISVRTFGF